MLVIPSLSPPPSLRPAAPALEDSGACWSPGQFCPPCPFFFFFLGTGPFRRFSSIAISRRRFPVYRVISPLETSFSGSWGQALLSIPFNCPISLLFPVHHVIVLPRHSLLVIRDRPFLKFLPLLGHPPPKPSAGCRRPRKMVVCAGFPRQSPLLGDRPFLTIFFNGHIPLPFSAPRVISPFE